MSKSNLSDAGGKPANKTKRQKPKKPYPEFPLWPHPNGQWCKKRDGSPRYYGIWGDPKAALALYLEDKENDFSGKTPQPNQDGLRDALTVKNLCDNFMGVKDSLTQNGELSPRSYSDYLRTATIVADYFGRKNLVSGINTRNFASFREALAKTRGPVSLGNEIQRVRVLFNFAYKDGLVDLPIRFGTAFKRPSQKVLRQERHAKGPKMFEADELRTIIDAATQPLLAMILLGINCGFGNHDCGTLPKSALDLDRAWIDYPRPKTAMPRSCPLWPETVQALREAIRMRPAAKSDEHEDLVFITRCGVPWSKDTASNPVSFEMVKLLDRLNLHKPGVVFYALRHTFETIGGGSRDQIAVNHIMGHVDKTMSANYRERIDDERLVAVTDHVRKWLGPDGSAEGGGQEDE